MTEPTSVSASELPATAEERSSHLPFLLMRTAAASVGCAALLNFWSLNRQTEEYLAQYEKFAPWSWNLYLSLFLAGAVGLFSLWNQAKWGLWLFAAMAMLALFGEFYAMEFSLWVLRIPLALVIIWLATQPVLGRLK